MLEKKLTEEYFVRFMDVIFVFYSQWCLIDGIFFMLSLSFTFGNQFFFLFSFDLSLNHESFSTCEDIATYFFDSLKLHIIPATLIHMTNVQILTLEQLEVDSWVLFCTVLNEIFNESQKGLLILWFRSKYKIAARIPTRNLRSVSLLINHHQSGTAISEVNIFYLEIS